MIAINLLPISEFKSRRRGQVFVAAVALLLLVLVAGLYSFKSNVMDTNIARLDSEISQANIQSGQLKKEVDAASLVTVATVKKWQQLEAIVQLEERRRDQTRILVELDNLLPRDSAWLVSATHNNAGLLTINGVSKDKEIISQFLDKLEKAEYIEGKTVNLVQMAQDMVINEIALTTFTVTAQTRFPQPAMLDKGLPEQGLPSREEMLKVVEAVAPNLVEALKTGGASAAAAKKTL